MKAYVKRNFSAAHFLPDYTGDCKNLHGHTWLVEIWLEGPRNPKTGMLVDFKLVKNRIDELDHCCLNDLFENPTAENLVLYLYTSIPHCTKARLWESEDCYTEVDDLGDMQDVRD